MSIYNNPEVDKIIREHLDLCYGYLDQLIVDNKLIKIDKQIAIIKYLKQNVDIISYMNDKYIPLDNPKKVSTTFFALHYAKYCINRLEITQKKEIVSIIKDRLEKYYYELQDSESISEFTDPDSLI